MALTSAQTFRTAVLLTQSRRSTIWSSARRRMSCMRTSKGKRPSCLHDAIEVCVELGTLEASQGPKADGGEMLHVNLVILSLKVSASFISLLTIMSSTVLASSGSGGDDVRRSNGLKTHATTRMPSRLESRVFWNAGIWKHAKLPATS